LRLKATLANVAFFHLEATRAPRAAALTRRGFSLGRARREKDHAAARRLLAINGA